MERRPALLASTAAAVALVTGAFGYAATNLLTRPANDHVGNLVATVPSVPAPRPVQFVYDEVPAEEPAGPAPQVAPAVAATDAAFEIQDAPSPTTSTTSTSSTTTPAPAAHEPHDDHAPALSQNTHDRGDD